MQHLRILALMSGGTIAHVHRNPSFPNLFFWDRDKEFKSQRLWHEASNGCSVFSSKPRIPMRRPAGVSGHADAKPTTKGSGAVKRSSKYRRYVKMVDAKVNRPEAPLDRDDHTAHFSFHPENMTSDYRLVAREPRAAHTRKSTNTTSSN